MKIFVKAKTGAKADKVIPPAPKLIPEIEDWYKVEVKERPIQGRANEAIIKLLAEHFHQPRSKVKLLRGASSKQKVFEIS